ncbi:hypothetical protein BROUX41_002800 [Berkeleyomyces rouxiae]|uniref:uncharacterized protein n=1 Tax=Berkeleyomyces rouxiae TaxID=2035830 RepID=UPI003B77B4BE
MKLTSGEAIKTTAIVSPPTVSPPTPAPPPSHDLAPHRVQTYTHLRASQSHLKPRNVSAASAATNSSVETAFRGSVNSGKPSFWSVPESVRSLVGSSAHISEVPSTTTPALLTTDDTSDNAHPEAARASYSSNILHVRLPISSTIQKKPISSAWQASQLDGCEPGIVENSQEEALLPKRGKLQKFPKGSHESDITLRPRSESRNNNPKEKSLEYGFHLVTLVRLVFEISFYQRFLLCIGVVTAIAAGCTLPTVSVIIGQLVYDITKFYTASNSNELTKEAIIHSVHNSIFHFLYLGAARFVLIYGTSILFQTSSLQITTALQEHYLRSLLSHPLSVHDALPSNWSIHALIVTVEHLQTGLSEHLPLLLSKSAMIISAMVVAFIYNWKLACMIFAAFVPIAAIYALSSGPTDRATVAVKDINSRACGVVLEALSMARTIIAFGAQKQPIAQYSAVLEQSSRKGTKITRLFSVQQATFAFILFGTNALAAYYGVHLYISHDIPDIGTMITVFVSMIIVATSISAFNQPIQSLALATEYAGFLYNFIDIPSVKNDETSSPNDFSFGDITFKDVSLSYFSRPDVKVLDNVSFTILKDKITAIVGPPGAGKSSIAALIERWYELNPLPFQDSSLCCGRIFCGDRPLSNIDLGRWRSQIGFVAQEPYFFDGTVEENIKYGLFGSILEHESPEAKKELVKRACADAMALDFISELPNGLQTRFKDCESTLSIGQKRLIAIARAMIRDPKLLILDEITQSLGGREEIVVLNAVAKASRNRTTLIISQRLSATVNADNIIVLVHGSVVQNGSYNELIQDKDGAYVTLATSQHLDVDSQTSVPRPSTWWRRRSGLVPLMLEGFEFTENREWEQSMRRGLDLMTIYAAKNPAAGSTRSSGVIGFCCSFLKARKKLIPWYLLLAFGTLIIGVASAFQPYLFAHQIMSFLLKADQQEHVEFWCLMFVATSSTASLGYLCSTWATTHLSFKLFEDLRRDYFTNIINQPVPFFDEISNSNKILTTAVTTDSDQLQRLLSSTFGIVMISIFSVLGSLVICLYLGWELTAISTGTAMPLIALLSLLTITDKIQCRRFNTRNLDEAERFATETLAAIRTITSLKIERVILSKHHTFLQAYIGRSFHKRVRTSILVGLSDSLSFFWMAFVLWYAVRFMENRKYQLFDFLVILFSVVQQGIARVQCPNISSNFADATIAAKLMLSREPRNDELKNVGLPKTDSDTKCPKIEQGRVDIEFLNVWLKYPKHEISMLTGLNIKIKHGDYIAIVGGNESGKTSILSLLERLYEPTRGTITVNGISIKYQTPETWRRSVATVTRAPDLITDTIRSNIMLGALPDTGIEKLYEASRAAGIHELALSLPEGYDTVLDFGGAMLSAIQRIRVALARALIRNPKLLLLDEVTDGLNQEDANTLHETIDFLREGRSVVITTQRVDTAQKASMIYVLQEGVVVEIGTHDELMHRKKVYYYMSLAQTLS